MKVFMPKVFDCDILECVYNHKNKCHARAINVGGPEPLCGTYMEAATKPGYNGNKARVGACKVAHCIHNNDLECDAKGVRVKSENSLAVCNTFKNR